MTQRSILLAHLSDVHLAPMPGLMSGLAPTALSLKRALGAANWLRARRHVHVRAVLDAIVADMQAQAPDHIIVSGDLVNLGLPQEHVAALAWLQSLGAPARITVVPGNHDAYGGRRGDPGYLRWAKYLRGDDGAEADRSVNPSQANSIELARPATFPFVRRRGPVALIGLGSGVPTPPFVSAGHLGAAQRDGLRRCLVEARHQGLARIVVVHHPLDRYSQAWRTGLRDAADVHAVLRDVGADMVVHGHFHRARVRWIEGGTPIPVVGVASASAALPHKGADLAGYNLYRVTLGEGPGHDCHIEMIRRGLAEPGGPIVELERVVLRSS